MLNRGLPYLSYSLHPPRKMSSALDAADVDDEEGEYDDADENSGKLRKGGTFMFS